MAHTEAENPSLKSGVGYGAGAGVPELENPLLAYLWFS